VKNKAVPHKVVIFDVETTGIDPSQDQIIELCVQYAPERDAPQQTWRIKPQTPISPEAQSVHGITMDDLRECPDFASYEQTFRNIFESAEVLIGYNLEFDLNFLQS
jgi:DNA polymerase-3 subunit epsilon